MQSNVTKSINEMSNSEQWGVSTAYAECSNKYLLLQFAAEAGIPHGKPTMYHVLYFLPFASAEHILNELQIYGIDAASGAAILALDVRPGDHVLDLCAAPGKLPYQYFFYWSIVFLLLSGYNNDKCDVLV